MNLLTLVLREVIASYLTGNKRCAKWTDHHKGDSLIFSKTSLERL